MVLPTIKQLHSVSKSARIVLCVNVFVAVVLGSLLAASLWAKITDYAHQTYIEWCLSFFFFVAVVLVITDQCLEEKRIRSLLGDK